jgi:signal transduction histidine kinase
MPMPRLLLALWRRRRLRPQHAVVALSVLLVVLHGASTAFWLWRAASRGAKLVPSEWYRECAASLIGFSLFAGVVAALAWISVGTLGRSQLAAALLHRSAAGLKRQTSLLQSTLENIGEGLSVIDARGRLVACNQRFCRLLDLPPDLGTGTALADILMRQAVRGDFGAVEPETEAARRLDQFYREVPVNKERVTPAGRTLQIRRRAMPNGAILSVYSDITEIKESERKIHQARSQAEAANRSKGEFLANMSHELRTPLNAIIGFSEIISNELFGPVANHRYLEYIKDILASSLHLLSIINDVLDMSKIEAGKLELAKEAVTLQHIIADVIRMMRERAEARGISLVPCVTPDDIVMWADERALKQILLNLLSNSIKFSSEGGTISIRLASASDDWAVIEVEDRGIGMTDEEQERALQPFGQAKPVITREYGGTGLGLPITKGLVEAHGGTLTISSRVGWGTTIRIVLPTEASRSAAEVHDLVWQQPVRDD